MSLALLLSASILGQLSPEPTEFSGQSQILVAPLRGAMCCVLSPDEQWLVAGYGHANHRGLIRVLDAKTGKLRWQASDERGVKAIAISPDGGTIATGTYGGQIKLLDAASGDVKLTMHESQGILGLAFSPDGLTLASASVSRVARLWAVNSGKPRRTLLIHSGNVNAIQFSEDGQRVLTCSADKTAKVSSASDGRVLQTFNHSDGVPCAVFLPGNRIATASTDGMVRVYSLDDGSLVTTLAGDSTTAPAVPQSLSASRDGQRLAFNSGGSLHLFDIGSWQMAATLDGHEELVNSVAINRDATAVVSAGDDSTVRMWDVEKKLARHIIQVPAEDAGTSGPVQGMAQSPDGKLLAIASGEGPVRIHDRTAGTVRVLENSEGAVSVAFSPHGHTLACGGGDGVLRLWDIASGQASDPHFLEGGNALTVLAWSPDGNTVAAASPHTNVIFFWNEREKKESSEQSDNPWSITFMPDGKRLLVGSGRSGAVVCNLEKRPIVHTPLAHDGPVRAIAVSPDGSVIATGGDDNVINLWDGNTFKRRALLLGHQQAVQVLAFSPQGKTLASGGAGGGVMTWDVERGVARKTLNGHTGTVTGLSFLPDSAGILSSSHDETVRLWKAVGGVIPALASQPAHQPKAFAARFSPDGKWLATGGDNKVVTLRDPETGVVKKTLSGHTGLVFDAAFSPDSTLVASASADGTVRVWRVSSGALVAAYDAYGTRRSNIRSVAFSSDGREIASGSEDGAIVLWSVADEKIRERMPVQALPVLCVRYSPDGSLLATSTGMNQRPKETGELRLWDVRTGKEVAALAGHTSEIKRVAFDDSGRRLASVGERSVIVWNVAQRQIEARVEADAVLTAISFLGEGDLLATGDARGGVVIYSIESAAAVHRYAGHTNIVPSITVRPDGQVIATASHDGTVKLWPAPAALVAEQN